MAPIQVGLLNSEKLEWYGKVSSRSFSTELSVPERGSSSEGDGQF